MLKEEDFLFKAFSDAYVKALWYLGKEKSELAKTQYLKMFDLHSRLSNLQAGNVLLITNKNLQDVFNSLRQK